MPWELIIPSSNSGWIDFSVYPATQVVVEISGGKPSWDFAGWIYPVYFSSLGFTEGKWSKIFLRKKQKIFVEPEECKNELNWIYRVSIVHWLADYGYTVSLWRWNNLVSPTPFSQDFGRDFFQETTTPLFSIDFSADFEQ